MSRPLIGLALASLGLLAACAGHDAPCADTDAATAGGEAGAALPLVVMDIDEERAAVPIDGRPARGASEPLVTIVEITDFECPFCSRVQPTIERLLEAHPEVRLVVRNSPLPMHRYAALAAEAALEAYAQGGDDAYFRMIEQLFQNQRALEPEDLAGYAAQVGLDVDRFEAALEDHRHRAAVEEDLTLAAEVGVNGTPAFFITGRLLLGARPYDDFEAMVLEEKAAAEALVAQGLPRARVYEAILAAARASAERAGEADDDLEAEAEEDDEAERVYALPVPANRPSRGPADAPGVIQELSDFQCPSCSRVRPTLDALTERFGAEVRVVFRHYPLPFHEHAALAAEAAQEVYEQLGDEAFWRYHDVLFDNQPALAREDLERYAQALGGVDMRRFRRALDRRTHQATVASDVAAVEAAGADIGTPSFFVDGRLVQGAQPLPVFTAAVERALAEARARSTEAPADE